MEEEDNLMKILSAVLQLFHADKHGNTNRRILQLVKTLNRVLSRSNKTIIVHKKLGRMG
jgi:hypothetical protein